MTYLRTKSFFKIVILFQCMLIASSLCFANELAHRNTKNIVSDSISYTTTSVNPTCTDPFGGSIDIETDTSAMYLYEWKKDTSTIAITQDIDSLSAGIYTLIIQDIVNNCTAMDTIKLTDPAPIQLQMDSIPSCFATNSGIAIVTVIDTTITYTTLWSNQMTTDTIKNLAPDTYSVTITSTTDGCIAIDSVKVDQSTAIELNMDSTAISCFGLSDGMAGVTASGGITDDYTYAWSNGGMADTINDLTVGTYQVIVTDNNGCTATDTIMVSQPDAIQLELREETSAGCSGNEGTANVTPSGGTITNHYTYTWSNGGITDTIINLTANTYYVTVTDDNNCTMIDSITISGLTGIQLDANSTPVTCFGSNDGTANVSAGIGDYTYEWSNGDTTDTAINLSEGIYVVTVTDINNCVATTSVTISQPDAIQLELSGTSAGCSGNEGTANVTPSGGTITNDYTYTWSNGDTTDAAINLTADTYYVTVTDDNNCTMIDSITISNLASIQLGVNTTSVTCFDGNDGTANVSAGVGDYTYEWSNGDTTATIVNLSVGIYNVTVTDANNCTANTEIRIEEPDPVPPILNIEEVVFENNIEQTVVVETDAPTIYWQVSDSDNIDTSPPYEENGTSQGSPLLTFTLSENRAPGLVVLDIFPQAGGCIGEVETINIHIFPDGGPIFIPEVFSPNSDGINDEWTVLFATRDTPDNYAINVFSRNGQKVYSNNSMADTWKGDGMPDGAYYYIIMDKANDNQYKGIVSILR